MGNEQQPANGEKKIQCVRYGKRGQKTLHAILGKQEKDHGYVQQGSQRIIADTMDLLGQSFQHPVCDRIQIEDRDQGCVDPDIRAGILTVKQQFPQIVPQRKADSCRCRGKHDAEA